MKVELINKVQANNLFETWGEFARICYNSPKGKESIIGKSCLKTGHYSGSRTTYFIFHIQGISRACTSQLNRHSVGVVINEQSMRYVDFSNAEITIPPLINNDEFAKKRFLESVQESKDMYIELKKYFENKGINGEKLNQDIRYGLPLGTQTEGMWAFTLEALEHLCHKRLCIRSQWEIRNLISLIKEEFKDMPLIYNRLVPQCQYLMWCPENHMTCGTFPTKDELKEKLRL